MSRSAIIIVLCGLMTAVAVSTLSRPSAQARYTTLPIEQARPEKERVHVVHSTFSGFVNDVYTVPAGKKLVLTDGVFWHLLSTTTSVMIPSVRTSSGLTLFEPYVHPQDNVIIGLTTGVELTELTTIELGVSGGSVFIDGVKIVLTGFLLDM